MSRFRRSRGDAGASAVEFALLFPVFMVLAMGTIAAGTAYSKQINITQSAREGSRFGATLDIPSIGGIGPWLAAVDEAVKGAAGNQNDPLGGYTHRCVAYVRTTTTPPPGNVTTIDAVNSRHIEDGRRRIGSLSEDDRSEDRQHRLRSGGADPRHRLLHRVREPDHPARRQVRYALRG